MDFETLLKPYSEDGRSVEGQIFWLSRKGLFSDDVINQAILNTYREIQEEGRTFDDGHHLDRYLYEKCWELSRNKMKKRKDDLQIIFSLRTPTTSKSWWRIAYEVLFK